VEKKECREITIEVLKRVREKSIGDISGELMRAFYMEFLLGLENW